VAKAGCVIGGMLAGADSIDDLDLLRHGGMDRLFGGVRAPSTLGTYLRSFTHGHVQQLDAVSSRLLAGLAELAPGLLAGADSEGIVFLDVDDGIREATAMPSRPPATATPACVGSTSRSRRCPRRSWRR